LSRKPTLCKRLHNMATRAKVIMDKIVKTIKTTLNDLAKRLLWEMQKSELGCKGREGYSKK
jgi:hypothetical protein